MPKPDPQVLEMYTRVGQMTRKLHDALHELGYDKSLERAASTIPDAKDRLAYIASLTENAAMRALNATDQAGRIRIRSKRRHRLVVGMGQALRRPAVGG